MLGLLLPVTLALHLGLPQLVDRHLDLGRAPGRANTGDKIVTLVASALAGGDCIDDADVLRTGGTAGVIGCVVTCCLIEKCYRNFSTWGPSRPALIPALQRVPPWAHQPWRRPAFWP